MVVKNPLLESASCPNTAGFHLVKLQAGGETAEAVVLRTKPRAAVRLL